MGFLDAAGAGLNVAAEQSAKVGLDYFHSIIQKERDDRLNEMRNQFDLTTRERNKDDSTEERKRVAEFTKPTEINQGEGMLGPATGNTEELTKTTRPTTVAEASANAMAAGDVKTAGEIGKLDDKDAANAIKLQIAQGRFENALAIAQMKGDFGMMLGELKAEAANGNGKATELMRNWNFLTKDKGMTDTQAAEKLLTGKVGETETVSVESPPDDSGKKVTTTTKRKVNGQATTPAPAKAPIKFGELNK